MNRNYNLKNHLPVLFLIAYFILYFHRIIILGQSFIYGDFFNYVYPMKYYLAYWLKQNIIPYWDTRIYCGQPFLANPQSAILYPLSYLLVFFNSGSGASMLICIHYLVALLSFYYVMRKWGIRQPGAVFSSIVFTFNGSMLALHSLTDYLQAFTWLPLTVYFARRIADNEKKLFSVICTSIFLAMHILGGSPQFYMYTVLLISVFVLTNAPWKKNAFYRQPVIFLVLAVILSIMISSGQLVPSMETTLYSSRAQGVSVAEDSANAFELKDYLSTVLANLYYDSATQTSWIYIFQELRKFYLPSLYLGILPVLLALYVLGRNASRTLWFFGGFACFALLMSLGDTTPLYPFMRGYMPLFSLFRYPEKWAVYVTFCVSVLSGYGFDKLMAAPHPDTRQARHRRLKRAVFIILLLILTAVCWYCKSAVKYFLFTVHGLDPMTITAFDIAAYVSTVRSSLVFLIAGVFLLGASTLKQWKGKPLLELCLVLFISVDLFWSNTALLPTISTRFYTDPPQLATTLNRDATAFRISHLPISSEFSSMLVGRNLDRTYLASNIGSVYGIEYGAGLLILRTREMVEFWNALTDAPLWVQQRKMDLLNVRYVIAQTPVNVPNYHLKDSMGGRAPLVYENENCMPRFMVVSGIQDVNGKDEFFRVLQNPDTDFQVSAFSNTIDKFRMTARHGNISGQFIQADPGDAMSFMFPDCNRASVDFETATPGYLVWIDNFMPGWKVYINDTESSTGRVNHFMKCVKLENDSRKIDWAYAPYSSVIGIYISLFIAGSMAFLCAWSLHRFL